MYPKKLLALAAIIGGTTLNSVAQSIVPTNIDFEAGTTSGWQFYRGTVATGHTYSLTSCAAVPGLHTLTSGSGTDYYGGFPEVGLGSYSLKLAKDTSNNNADAASYHIQVPTTGSYDFLFHYAAVVQDPGHMPSDQPIFEVSAIDSIPDTTISSIQMLGSTTGLYTSTVLTGTKYMPWTSGSISLAAFAGRTVTIKAVAAGCGTAGHWGYGYLDADGLFASAMPMPAGAPPTITLTAPGGYASYLWTDSATMSASYGSMKSVSVTSPTSTKTYAVIVTPPAGHGSVDTLYTRVIVTTPPPSVVGYTGAQSATVALFPNPASGELNIGWSNQRTGIAQVNIADMTGRVVSQTSVDFGGGAGSTKVDLSGFTNGLYIVTIKSDEFSYSGRVMVQK